LENPEIFAAICGLLGVIISVFASAKVTQDKVTRKLESQNEVQNTKIEQLGVDMKNIKIELTEKMDAANKIEELKIEHINESLETLKIDVKEHNHYAQMFNETIPVLQEKMKVENHRMDDLEAEVKELMRDKREK